MKVRVKNNRLALEGHLKNLEEASDEELRKVAAKYQIGWQTFVEKEVPVQSRGITKMRTEQVVQPKSRKQLEDEIRKRLTVTLYVPKEYWTEEQEEAFTSNDLMNEKDINREREVKKAANIMQVIPPYEDVGDKITEAKMLGELTEDQWEYFKDQFNYKIKRVKDDEGKVVDKKKNYVHRLMAVEYIPENEKDQERLDKENEKEEEKKSKSKKK